MLSFRTGRPEWNAGRSRPCGCGRADAAGRGLNSAAGSRLGLTGAAGVLPRGASRGTPGRRQPASRTSRATRAGSVRTTSRVPTIK